MGNEELKMRKVQSVRNTVRSMSAGGSGSNSKNVENKRAAAQKTPETKVSMPKDDTAVQKRISLARDPNTPANILLQLATDDYSGVRRALAENPSLPLNVQVTLAKDIIKLVRRTLARNQNLFTETMRILASDHDEIVRICIATNNKTPAKVLSLIKYNESYAISKALQENENAPAELRESAEKCVQAFLADNKIIKDVIMQMPK